MRKERLSVCTRRSLSLQKRTRIAVTNCASETSKPNGRRFSKDKFGFSKHQFREIGSSDWSRFEKRNLEDETSTCSPRISNRGLERFSWFFVTSCRGIRVCTCALVHVLTRAEIRRNYISRKYFQPGSTFGSRPDRPSPSSLSSISLCLSFSDRNTSDDSLIQLGDL